jgi:hypothetical protein
MSDLGFWGRVGGMSYIYSETTPFVNAILNMKYLIEFFPHPDRNREFWEIVYSYGAADLLVNTMHLPLGFMVDNEAANFTSSLRNPIETQNTLFRSMTGLDYYLFAVLEYKSFVEYDEGRYLIFEADMSYSGVVYIFVFVYVEAYASVYADGEYVGTVPIGDPPLLRVAKFDEGTTIRVSVDISDSNATGFMHAGIFNYEVFEKGFDILSREVLELTYFSDTLVRGNITTEGGLLYTSIPHMNRWRIFVNGEEREVTSIAGAMLGVLLEAGEHEIEFRYHNRYLHMGAGISLVSLLLLVGMVRAEKKFTREFKVEL